MTAEHTGDGTTVGQLLVEVAEVLRSADPATALGEARELISALYDVPRFWPAANGSARVEAPLRDRALQAARTRVRGAPLAYAVGRANFRLLTLAVDERVLIPRPETELLIDLVLRETASVRGGIAVDVGTGSGAIAIALSAEGAGRFARLYAIDISPEACAVAQANVQGAAALLTAPIEVLQGSLLAPVAGIGAHVVVSNPPYIALSEADSLPPSVREWEPATALFSGADGMTATAQLVQQAGHALVPDGLLAMEVDSRRAALAAELVTRDGRFRSVRIERDLTGRERFVLARRHEGDGE